MLTVEKVKELLSQIKEPSIKASIIDLGLVRDIRVNEGNVSVKLAVIQEGSPEQMQLQQEVVQALKGAGAASVGLRFEAMTEEEKNQLAQKLSGQHNAAQQGGASGEALLSPQSQTAFIAVTSGKGGVGKSTVTVNLAHALSRLGKRVGIIDADIYGFSIPDMMGIEERPQVEGETIHPVEKNGIKVMSMGFFVEDNSPVIWRGPMLGKMLKNFFTEVEWGELDYLILDLPPGTGDVALDVHQMLPQSKEIIVTTPHTTAAFVAARAGAMALKTNHEILGVVENMSYYALPNGERDFIFGQGGGKKLAEVLKSELLAQVPLGQPHDGKETHSIYPADSLIGEIYGELGKRIIEKLN